MEAAREASEARFLKGILRSQDLPSLEPLKHDQERTRKPNPNFLVEISSGRVGVFHVKGWGPKSSVRPSKSRETKFFRRIDFPGFCRDIPGVPEKFAKRKFVFNSCPLQLLPSRLSPPTLTLEPLLLWYKKRDNPTKKASAFLFVEPLKTFQGGPGSVTVWRWNGSSSSGFRFRRFFWGEQFFPVRLSLSVPEKRFQRFRCLLRFLANRFRRFLFPVPVPEPSWPLERKATNTKKSKENLKQTANKQGKETRKRRAREEKRPYILGGSFFTYSWSFFAYS